MVSESRSSEARFMVSDSTAVLVDEESLKTMREGQKRRQQLMDHKRSYCTGTTQSSSEEDDDEQSPFKSKDDETDRAEESFMTSEREEESQGSSCISSTDSGEEFDESSREVFSVNSDQAAYGAPGAFARNQLLTQFEQQFQEREIGGPPQKRSSMETFRSLLASVADDDDDSLEDGATRAEQRVPYGADDSSDSTTELVSMVEMLWAPEGGSDGDEEDGGASRGARSLSARASRAAKPKDKRTSKAVSAFQSMIEEEDEEEWTENSSTDESESFDSSEGSSSSSSEGDSEWLSSDYSTDGDHDGDDDDDESIYDWIEQVHESDDGGDKPLEQKGGEPKRFTPSAPELCSVKVRIMIQKRRYQPPPFDPVTKTYENMEALMANSKWFKCSMAAKNKVPTRSASAGSSSRRRSSGAHRRRKSSTGKSRCGSQEKQADASPEKLPIISNGWGGGGLAPTEASAMYDESRTKDGHKQQWTDLIKRGLQAFSQFREVEKQMKRDSAISAVVSTSAVVRPSVPTVTASIMAAAAEENQGESSNETALWDQPLNVGVSRRGSILAAPGMSCDGFLSDSDSDDSDSDENSAQASLNRREQARERVRIAQERMRFEIEEEIQRQKDELNRIRHEQELLIQKQRAEAEERRLEKEAEERRQEEQRHKEDERKRQEQLLLKKKYHALQQTFEELALKQKDLVLLGEERKAQYKDAQAKLDGKRQEMLACLDTNKALIEQKAHLMEEVQHEKHYLEGAARFGRYRPRVEAVWADREAAREGATYANRELVRREDESNDLLARIGHRPPTSDLVVALYSKQEDVDNLEKEYYSVREELSLLRKQPNQRQDKRFLSGLRRWGQRST